MVPYLRLYKISLINYLKYEVLPVSFLEYQEDIPLEYDSEIGGYTADTDMTPHPTSKGRGWVFFDESVVNGKVVIDISAEQSSRVSVDGASSYTIDYINGAIINPDSVPTSVSYYWNYVSIVDGWPGEDPPPMPVIALDIPESNKSGFQLGGGTKDSIRGSIHVFATSEAEKLDLVDSIHNALFNRSIPVKNWHEGGFIKYDGTFNTGFSPTLISGLSSAEFIDVKSSFDGPGINWSELNRYRGKIDFKFEVRRD